jgi:hypothetical protein
LSNQPAVSLAKSLATSAIPARRADRPGAVGAILARREQLMLEVAELRGMDAVQPYANAQRLLTRWWRAN